MELQDLPANEYNNEAGDLNKYDALKALYPTPAEISKEGKIQPRATFTSNLAAANSNLSLFNIWRLINNCDGNS
jgi:hypothetical protein